jgi:succinate dehydrogenase/fumarate reductase flavoprotein subunit
MHGEGLLAGNILLDDLVGGRNAGAHAGAWAAEAKFAGSNLVEESSEAAKARIEALQNSTGSSVGQVAATLSSIMASCGNGSRDEASLKAAAASLATLKSTGIKVTDSSMVMNTELSAALEVEGMISIAEQIASS